LKINGRHFDLGAGILNHPDDKTTYGFFAGVFFGSGKESEISRTLRIRSRNGDNTAYYNISEHTMNSNYMYKTSGVKPY
jgi:hypothetical protein